MQYPNSNGTNGIVKSISTIQLLGELQEIEKGQDNFNRPNDLVSLGSTSEGIEITNDIEVLINTSKSVLSTVQILRRVIREYTYGRIGRELQHLSLTIASFERVLFSFIKEEIVEPHLTYTTSNSSLCELHFEKQKNNPKYQKSSALKDIVLLIDKDRRHAILSGGIASLLRHSTTALEDTKSVLEGLHSPLEPIKNSLYYMGHFLSLFGMIIALKKYMKSKSFRHFLHHEVVTFKTLQYAIVSIIGYDYFKRLLYRFSRVRYIKICHSRVLVTLRLFLLCQHILQRSRLTRTGSQHMLITSPCEVDIDDNLKNATTLLIERVPIPADYYNFTSSDMGLKIFKKGSDVFMAASATSYQLVGGNQWLWKSFGKFLQALFIPYYILNHNIASVYATRVVMDHPNIDIIRLSWSTFGESYLSKKIALLLSPNIRLRDQIFINVNGNAAGKTRRTTSDIPVRLFSVRSMLNIRNGTWEDASIPLTNEMKQGGLPQKRIVIFHVHGGGFFGRLLAYDLLTLSEWAVKSGALIIYPDYSLSPEYPYPFALEQCLTVYEWLTIGGLGFQPDRIVISGESAGGNIAAALCYKIMKHQLPNPDGLFLAHPALNLYVSPSASRFLHQNDPILPRGVLELALNSYYPQHGNDVQYIQNIHDPFVSPGDAPDEMISKLPATYLLVGGLDPLLDDSVDFNTRLRKRGIVGNLRVFPGLSHGFFLCTKLVPEAQEATNYAINTISKMLYM